MTLEEKIAAIVRENSEVKADVGPGTDLRKDLDIDSFGTIMIVNAIEDQLNITIDETDLRAITTVADITELLVRKYHVSPEVTRAD
jgi:acyl carrier protein